MCAKIAARRQRHFAERSVVGTDGFGFARDGDHWEKIAQSGPTVLENDVEVQANSCIDRASIGETRVARGVKIDNLVQVGHGSAVGEHTLLCAQVGLAGSTVVGKNVIIAGQAGVAGHCNIGDGVIMTAQSGTHGDIPARHMVSGSPAFDHKQWLRAVDAFRKLPEIARTVRSLTHSQAQAVRPQRKPSSRALLAGDNCPQSVRFHVAESEKRF